MYWLIALAILNILLVPVVAGWNSIQPQTAAEFVGDLFVGLFRAGMFVIFSLLGWVIFLSATR